MTSWMAKLWVLSAVVVGTAYAREVAQFWHFTDTHLETPYVEGTDPANGCYDGKGNAGRYGDPKCDTPAEVVTSSFNLVAGTKPAFILWTGDMIPHAGPFVTLKQTEAYLRNITDLLKAASKAAGGVPVFPLLGNHDSFPQHQMTPTHWWSYAYAADLWAPFLTSSAQDSLRTHARYVMQVSRGLRIVAINTVLYYTNNGLCPVVPNRTDPAGQIAWLRQQLADAKKSGDRVFLAGHLPPGWNELSTSGNGSSPLRESQNDMVVDALDGFHDVVAGSFWGHVHTDSFRVWRDSKDPTKASPVFLTGSLDEMGRDPAVRVFTYDANTFDPVDIDNYGFNVAEANARGTLEWKHIYKATTEYGVADLTARSLEQLHGRMVVDDALFQKYNRHVRGNLAAKHCSGACKTFVLCAMDAMRNADHLACVQNPVA